MAVLYWLDGLFAERPDDGFDELRADFSRELHATSRALCEHHARLALWRRHADSLASSGGPGAGVT